MEEKHRLFPQAVVPFDPGPRAPINRVLAPALSTVHIGERVSTLNGGVALIFEAHWPGRRDVTSLK